MSSPAKVLVAIPGLGFSASILESIAADIAELLGCDQVILVDYDGLNSLDDILQRVDDSTSEQKLLFGWSLGGLIADAYAAKFPDRTAGLITCGSLPKFAEAERWIGIKAENLEAIQSLAKRGPELFNRRFSALVRYPERTLDLEEWIQRESVPMGQLELLEETDQRVQFSRIAQSSLHLFGSEDAIVPVASATQLTKINSSARIAVIEGAGHLPFITHRQQFLQQVDRWMS